MTTTDDRTPPRSIGSQLLPLRRNVGWLYAAGIALIALGVIGLVFVGLTSVTATFLFGWLMAIGGFVLIVDAFRRPDWGSRLLAFAIGLLYLATAVLVFYNPLAALVALTLMVAIMLIAVGAMRIVMAFNLRPNRVWGWVLTSGILSLLLGALILLRWPASSAWVLGIFLAIELIAQGWAYVALGRAVRSTMDGVAPTRG